MNITAQYTEDGSIAATINGQDLTIPDQAGNRHRQSIAEWEAEGNTIAAYVPATVDQLRVSGRAQIISMLENLVSQVTSKYLSTDQPRWPGKELEANTFLDIPEANRVSSDAPNISAVFDLAYPDKTDSEKLALVTIEATAIQDNAFALRQIDTFTEVVRELRYKALTAATTEAEILQVVADAETQINQGAAAFGLA